MPNLVKVDGGLATLFESSKEGKQRNMVMHRGDGMWPVGTERGGVEWCRGVGVEDGDNRRGTGEARHRGEYDVHGGSGDGGGAHVHAHVRGVRDGRGPKEGNSGRDRTPGHRLHRPGPDLRGRALQRRVHEPGPLVRPRRGGHGLHQPLGLLRRPLRGRRARGAHLRRRLHLPRSPGGPPTDPLRLLEPCHQQVPIILIFSTFHRTMYIHSDILHIILVKLPSQLLLRIALFQ